MYIVLINKHKNWLPTKILMPFSTKKIGYTDEISGRFVPQYTALFLVMNSTVEIVDYKLTVPQKWALWQIYWGS